MSGFAILKTLVAACIISFAAWLSNKRPVLAGFIVAMPLVSILAIGFSYWEHGNADQTIKFAKSILIAVPISWGFFIPFFFADRFGLGVWQCLAIGIVLIGVGYLLYRSVIKFIF